MNKNILILTVVLFGLVSALGALLMLSKNPASPLPSPVIKNTTMQDINKSLNELNNLDADLVLISKDDVVLQEMDTALIEVGEINEATASLSGDESNLNGLDGDLTTLSGDEKIDQEIDRSLQDMSL